ncbi:ATP-binding protein [Paenibacillus sp.]|uniref:ATP-binding protein n=1 Tax=Paenibacillus sp. TaxID=58172 RepID=UPI002D2983F6|nr:ATP-binding protein [Paenibacillus sp.]HZG86112.1 ATP-binding protein [Paenibacillus sp.]
MKISAKLGVGFGSIASTMLLLSALAVGSLSLLEQQVKNITQSQYPKVETAAAIDHDIGVIARSMRNYVLAASETVRTEELRRLEAAEASAVESFETMRQLATDEATAVAVSKLGSVGADYLLYQDQVMDLAQAGRTAEASRLLTEEAGPFQALTQAVDELQSVSRLSVQRAAADAEREFREKSAVLISISLLALTIGGAATFWFSRTVVTGLRRVSGVMNEFASGTMDAAIRVTYRAKDEIGAVAEAFNAMADALQRRHEEGRRWAEANETQLWLHTHLDRLIVSLQQAESVEGLSERLLRELSPVVGAVCGVVYASGADDRRYELAGAYAIPAGAASRLRPSLTAEDGLAGLAIATGERQLLRDTKHRELRISSALLDQPASAIYVYPIRGVDQVEAVLEFAVREELTYEQEELIRQLSTRAGLLFNKAKNQHRIASLLRKSQELTEELQQYAEELNAQQEELMQSNAELEEQTAALQQSEKLLQEQQKRLTTMNAELEGKAEEAEAANRELEKRARQLLAASTYKSEFLANMSHELRTPLNSMLILAKLLSENKEGRLTDKQVEYAATIYSSGNDLLSLINQILDLASVESGKMQIQEEPVPTRDVEDFVRRNFGAIALQKGIELRFESDPDIPVSVLTDPLRLQQILRNLLSNAFKFTERGSVTFAMRRRERGGEPPALELAVRDTGIGIPKEKQEHVFDAFVQIDGSIRRKYGGTGLGLSISRELAAMLGGEIRLESEVGKGSAFTLILPIRKAAAAARELTEELGAALPEIAASAPPIVPTAPAAASAAEPAEPRMPAFPGRTILIVDDDIRNVFALSSRLESCGVQTLHAENGKAAIEVLEAHEEIDLVLMDVMMPEMDGYEAIRRIRANPVYAELPIITVTAKAMKEDREMSLSAGASDYITKPIDMDRLMTLLAVWLHGKA